ncbi:glycoside hydrolase family 2 protein [Arthrobacter sp. B2a2-09]|uniref:glycoside hydrolase family 2 protein n=1 Tax=Arthrobacter sp. B2a2-09 TaxID=2952822 RepID=UPI0022CD662B|nr:glycoside hydrolase family 2 protein [Arthrobacter sp. B2a2-09]MCZ9883301.1 glycoside hydrolase family 2 protein [Arthrobacter sp. B2a2-09]
MKPRNSSEGSDVETVSASVPGCVHTDLMASGIIPDPYLADNETLTSWIGHSGWIYRCEIPGLNAADGRTDLVFEGLDTFAEVRLNGTLIGGTTSMFTTLRIDVTEHLPLESNLLEIRFEAPYAKAMARQNAIGSMPNPYDEPYPHVRKTASNFGWDWGPTLVTAGIWKPVYLETWAAARIASVIPTVTVDDGAGRVSAQVNLQRQSPSAGELHVEISLDGRTFSAAVAGEEQSITIPIELASPELWWPRGYGEPNTYSLVVSLLSANGAMLDGWERQIGFRTVEIDATPDGDGSPFTILVNGVPIFVKGANWIPDDCFPARVGQARYVDRLEQAVAANVNFVRVWGGGNYESDEFFDIADQLGILVAQDFLFACAAYPETAELLAEVESEVRENVTRLSSHPSLVLWFGGNENMWGYEDWEWKPVLGDRKWGSKYYLDLLPSLLSELDPTRPYWPNSPYSGSPDVHPNDPAHGSSHVWDVWNTEDYGAYRNWRPRFVAEFGYQAPASYSTLLEAVGGEELRPESPILQHHQKALDGEAKLQRGLDDHFPPIDSFDDWLFATQLNQARAITTGIEHFRALQPLCMGTVLWQLNDCWPALSWSVIDSAARLKPSWYALRRAYAERIITIQPFEGSLALVAINDSDEHWRFETFVRRTDFAGSVLAEQFFEIHVGPRSNSRVKLDSVLCGAENPTRELVVADTGGLRATWFFQNDKDLDYPTPSYTTTMTQEETGVRVNVTANSFLRDLAIFADRVDPKATVDDMLVTLLPGEHSTFFIHTASNEPERFGRAPVLRSANDLKLGSRKQ